MMTMIISYNELDKLYIVLHFTELILYYIEQVWFILGFVDWSIVYAKLEYCF